MLSTEDLEVGRGPSRCGLRHCRAAARGRHRVHIGQAVTPVVLGTDTGQGAARRRAAHPEQRPTQSSGSEVVSDGVHIEDGSVHSGQRLEFELACTGSGRLTIKVRSGKQHASEIGHCAASPARITVPVTPAARCASMSAVPAPASSPGRSAAADGRTAPPCPYRARPYLHFLSYVRYIFDIREMGVRV